jgi:uncharacterized protein
MSSTNPPLDADGIQRPVEVGDLETVTLPPERGAAPFTRTSARQRLLSFLEAFICSGFPTQVLVTIALAFAGVTMFATDGRLSLRYVVLLSLVDTVIVVGLIVVFLRGRGEAPGSVMFDARRPVREASLGVLLLPGSFVLIVAVAQAIERFAPWLKNPQGNPLVDLLRGPVETAVFAGVAMIAGGLREEMQRAFILHRFEQHLGGAAAGIIVFSAVFGLGHLPQGHDAAILTGLLGAFWGLVYLWRRSILAPAVCHALFNLVEVVSHGSQA